MKFTQIVVLALAAALAAPGPAFADTSLTAFDAARTALLAIWGELPLSARNVTLTQGTAIGYGNYTVHAGQSFTPDEQINVYVEVLGYGWKDNGDGTNSVLLDADLSLVDASGATLASQANFLTSNIVSRQKLLETFLTFTARLASFAPGNYTLRYTLHDRAGDKDAAFDVPITLLGANGASSSAPEASAPASSAPASEASAPASSQSGQ